MATSCSLQAERTTGTLARVYCAEAAAEGLLVRVGSGRGDARPLVTAASAGGATWTERAPNWALAQRDLSRCGRVSDNNNRRCSLMLLRRRAECYVGRRPQEPTPGRGMGERRCIGRALAKRWTEDLDFLMRRQVLDSRAV
jgi:hypothetical protein